MISTDPSERNDVIEEVANHSSPPSLGAVFGLTVSLLFIFLFLAIPLAYSAESGLNDYFPNIFKKSVGDKRTPKEPLQQSPSNSLNNLWKDRRENFFKSIKSKKTTIDKRYKKIRYPVNLNYLAEKLYNMKGGSQLNLSSTSSNKGMTGEFVLEWLAFLAYMETGGDSTFVRFPTLPHFAFSMSKAAQNGSLDKFPSELSTTFSTWGITQNAFRDTLGNQGNIESVLNDSEHGDEIYELINKSEDFGLPPAAALTATFYPRIAMAIRGLKADPTISTAYFMQAYSCYYFPARDTLSPIQKDRVKKWFKISNRESFNVFSDYKQLSH